MLEPFGLPFVQRGVWELALLSVGAGLLGTWIVARGLAFYAHGVTVASFPGLVVAAGVGLPALLGASAVAALFAITVGRLSAQRMHAHDAATAMALVGAIAAGVILASDVFHSGSDVETLLFGSLLVVDRGDVLLTGATSAAAVAAAWTLGSRWLLSALDGAEAHRHGIRLQASDQLLLALIALAAVASLSALGSLLAAALLVVPAATTRLWIRTVGAWQLSTIGLTLLEGVIGLWLSVRTNVPPGAAVATLAGGVFAVGALLRRALVVRRPGRRTLIPFVLIAAAVLVSACGGDSSGSSSSSHAGGSAATGGAPVDVVATTTQLGDFARAVGGPDVNVHQILQPNTDPHDYEPRPADVTTAAGAKLVVLSGNNLDRWMGKVLDASGTHAKRLTIAPQHTPEKLPGESSGPEASKYDPHWWHDPRNAEAAVGAIRDALISVDPAAKARLTQRANAYVARLRTLDKGIQACFSRVPAAQRKLVTSHDAFNYFAARYGIDVVGAVIPSQTTQAQPSARALAKLVALVRRQHVKAIFPESSINPKLARSLAQQTGARADYTLYGDTLGAAGSAGATYLTMEQANANAMIEGFTGGKDHCTIAGL